MNMTENGEPTMQVRSIKTRARHYKAFAHSHPLEFNGIVGVQHVEIGVVVKGMESREIYKLDSPDLKGPVAVDVTGIKRALAARRLPLVIHEAQLNQEWVDYTLRSNGVEEEGIARLKPIDLRRPGILIHWGNDHTTLVDGAHRLVRRWREGMTTFEFAYLRFEKPMLDYVARPDEMFKFYDRPEEKT
jgi:hypothetical protein